MILEAIEEDVREALAACTKEEVIDVFIALAVKHDPKSIEQGERGSKQEAIVKLGLFMVMWHFNQQAKESR